MVVELDTLLSEIERDDGPAVVVFDSADSDVFLADYDVVADPSPFDALRPAPTRRFPPTTH